MQVMLINPLSRQKVATIIIYGVSGVVINNETIIEEYVVITKDPKSSCLKPLNLLSIK
jgi:hypothetical protein